MSDTTNAALANIDNELSGDIASPVATIDAPVEAALCGQACGKLLSTEHGAQLFTYMLERENIRRRKEAGDPAPWTDDPILREFSFTNVRRSDDRTTRDLMANFYRPNVAGARPGDVLFNCAMARWFGRADAVAHIGWLTDWDADTAIARARQWSHTFAQAGTYRYHCTPHPLMKGTVIVDG